MSSFSPRSSSRCRSMQWLLLSACSLMAAQSAHAATMHWNDSGTGSSLHDWNTAGNWSKKSDGTGSVTVPGTADVATFNITSLTSAQTVNLNGNRSILGLAFNSSGTVALLGGGTNRTLTLGANGITVAAGAGAATIGSTTTGQNVAITLGSAQSWTNSSSNMLTINNAVTTAGYSLNVAGSGKFTANGAFDLGGGVLTDSGTGANAHNFYGIISNGSVIASNANGSGNNGLILNAANTYAGGTTLNDGSWIRVGNNSALGSGTVAVASGASATLATSNNTVPATATTLANTFVVNNNGTLNLDGGWATLTISGPIKDGSGSPGNVAGASSGTVILAGNNSFTGTLKTSSNDTLIVTGTNTNSTTTVISGGSLQLGTTSTAFTGNVGTGTITLNGTGSAAGGAAALVLANDSTGTGSATVSNVITGGGGLQKTGTGTFVLSGANNYTGNTYVNAGTLLVDGTHNNGSGNYIVGNGSAPSPDTLGGGGVINTTGTVTINGGDGDSALGGAQSNGQITGGDLGTIGTLTIHAVQTNLKGTYIFDVNYGSLNTPTSTPDETGDLLSFTGNVNLTGAVFKIGNETGTTVAGEHYAIKIFESATQPIGGPPIFQLSPAAIARGESVVTWDGGKTYYLVPEPSSFLLLCFSSLLLLRRPPRRRGRGVKAAA